MKKTFLVKLVQIIFIIISCFVLSSCSDVDKFADYSSGQRVELTKDNIANHLSKYRITKLEGKESKGLYYGVAYTFITSGYDTLSYFNVRITVKISYEALLDNGKYEEISFNCVIHLDEGGSGKAAEVEKFGNKYRNIKNIKSDIVEVEGFVVKK